MATPQERNSDPKEKNPQTEEDKKINPSKPGSDPDQTPERETNNPPVADPQQPDQDTKKIGFKY